MTGKELKEKREQLGLTTRELALAIGCAQSRIVEWENEKHAMGNAYDRILRDYFEKSAKEPK